MHDNPLPSHHTSNSLLADGNTLSTFLPTCVKWCVNTHFGSIAMFSHCARRHPNWLLFATENHTYDSVLLHTFSLEKMSTELFLFTDVFRLVDANWKHYGQIDRDRNKFAVNLGPPVVFSSSSLWMDLCLRVLTTSLISQDNKTFQFLRQIVFISTMILLSGVLYYVNKD